MKICKTCKIEKAPTEYYSNGAATECKSCAKARVKKRADDLKNDPEWIEKERARGREKYHRLNYKETAQPAAEKKKATISRFNQKYPEKIAAKGATCKMKPLIEGNQLHHWSYNTEHLKDVIELSNRDHKKTHRFMVYDQERFMYRRSTDNVLLDTKDEHLKWITYAINNFQD